METKELISHYQAAKILEVSPPTVYRLTDRRILKLYPVGKGNFLDKKEVEAYKNAKS